MSDSLPRKIVRIVILGMLLSVLVPMFNTPVLRAQNLEEQSIGEKTRARVIAGLTEKYGEKQEKRITRCVGQAAGFWRAQDGTNETFYDFCMQYYVSDPGELAVLLGRLERNFESLYGNFHKITRDLQAPFELSEMQILPIDRLFIDYNPFSHFFQDMFKTKIAFVILLNFPNYSHTEKLELGPVWNRTQWAMAAAGDIINARVPAHINQKISALYAQVDQYQYNYSIYMNRILHAGFNLPFEKEGMLLVHWGLRDRLRACYTELDGKEKQELIYRIMIRIIEQDIPAKMINSDDCFWDPVDNKVYKKKKKNYVAVDLEPEGGERYEIFLKTFKALSSLDPYYPNLQTHLKRSFFMERKMDPGQVEALLLSILKSPIAARTAKVIEKKLGRKLRPFDLWYEGFAKDRQVEVTRLDKLINRKYPNACAFQDDIPRILGKIGFNAHEAAYLASQIKVENSKGTGHALAAHMKDDKVYLRIRMPESGMNYMAYNLAIHELGHNVEQVYSLQGVDHYFLRGVPNTAITEAIAFLFGQYHLEILGESQKVDPGNLWALRDFWFTYETSGVALLDMRIWEWLYGNPGATVHDFQKKVISLAREIWNTYYAQVLGVKDSSILAVYSHLIAGGLYFPDYPLGQIISSQVHSHLEGKSRPLEIKRMCTLGSLPPEQWMKLAVGSSVSAQPLLHNATEALKYIEGEKE